MSYARTMEIADCRSILVPSLVSRFNSQWIAPQRTNNSKKTNNCNTKIHHFTIHYFTPTESTAANSWPNVRCIHPFPSTFIEQNLVYGCIPTVIGNVRCISCIVSGLRLTCTGWGIIGSEFSGIVFLLHSCGQHDRSKMGEVCPYSWHNLHNTMFHSW